MVLVGQVLEEAWINLAELLNVSSVSQPELFSVVVLFVLGFIGGKIFGELLRAILKMTALDDLAVKSDVQLLLRRFDYRGTMSDFVADIVTWLIYVLTVFAIFYLFGFTFITGYSETLLSWASRGVVAILVLIVGGIIAVHLEQIIVRLFRGGRMSGLVDQAEAEIPVYAIAGRATKYAGYIVTFLIALGVVGADQLLLNILATLFGLGVVILLVLSFRDVTRNIAISTYFQLSRVFRGGETVRIGEYEGRIKSIRPLYTKIEGGGRTYYIPNTELVSSVIEHKGE